MAPSPDPSPNHVRAQFERLSRDYYRLSKEWGGTRLLLRVIAGPNGRLTDSPPFETVVRHFDVPHPGDYPVTILRVPPKEYIGGCADAKWGQLCEGRLSPPSAARWGLFWFEHNLGWESFRTLALEAGTLLPRLPEQVRPRLQLYGLDPVSTSDPLTAWLLALFGSRVSGPSGPCLPPLVVTQRHEWIPVPDNRAQRNAVAQRQLPAARAALLREPLDDFAVLLDSEIYAASSWTCSVLRNYIPPYHNWDPPVGADPNESARQRQQRILVTLLAEKEGGAHPLGAVRWRTMSGVRRSDYEYLLTNKLIDAGWSPGADGADVFGDPEFMDVWLTPRGVQAAIELQDDGAQRQSLGGSDDATRERSSGKQVKKRTAKLSKEELEARETAVRDYINAKRATGVSIVRITRDAAAAATGIPAGGVSATKAWQALAKEKHIAGLPDERPEEEDPIDAAIESGDWDKVQAQQHRAQKLPRRYT